MRRKFWATLTLALIVGVIHADPAFAKKGGKKGGGKKGRAAAAAPAKGPKGKGAPKAAGSGATGGQIAVLPFEGPDAAKVRAHVVAGLQGTGFKAAPDKRVEQAKRKLGGTPESARDFTSLARDVKLACVVVGRVSKEKKGLSAEVEMRRGSDGEIVGTSTWKAKKAAQFAAIRASLKKKFASALQQCETPSGDERDAAATRMETLPPTADSRTRGTPDSQGAELREDKPEEPGAAASELDSEEPGKGSEAKSTEPSAPPGSWAHLPAFQIEGGLALVYRKLSYNVTDVSGYKLAFKPAVYAATEFYPGALVSNSAAARYVGLYARVLAAPWLKSDVAATATTPAGTYNTSLLHYLVAARVRYPLSEAIVPRLTLGYGVQGFKVTDDAGGTFPEQQFGHIYAGLGARAQFAEKFTFDIDAAYLHGVSVGDVAKGTASAPMSDGSVSGFQAQLLAAYRIMGALDGVLGLSFTNYSVSLTRVDTNPMDGMSPGKVSGTDTYFVISAGARYTFE